MIPVFEISTQLDDVRAVIPAALLHIHDTLYTGLVRKAQDAVTAALPLSLWPQRPHDADSARLPGQSLEGRWTVEWLNGTTSGASFVVRNGSFRVMDTDYVLQTQTRSSGVRRSSRFS